MQPPSAPEAVSRLRALQALRLKVHRLNPSRPLRSARAAASFVHERRLVMTTGRSSLPVLAEAIAGRHIAGSWMAHGEAGRIYRILRAINRYDTLACPLILGKHVRIDPTLGPALGRVATDPARQASARAALPVLARRLLDRVESRGRVRLDQWAPPTKEARRARLLLERELLVFGREVHTARGYHTTILLPWRDSAFAKRFSVGAARLAFEDATDQLLLAAARSAVVAPEAEVRRWFVFGGDRLASLLAAGRLERLRTPGGVYIVGAKPAAAR